MSQKNFSVTFKDGSILSLEQPAGMVGHCVLDDVTTDTTIGVIIACRTINDIDGPAAALNQARAVLPEAAGYKWVPTSKVWNGASSDTNPARFISIEAEIENGAVKLRSEFETDLTPVFHQRISDGPAPVVAGYAEYQKAITWLRRRQQDSARALTQIGKSGVSGAM